MELMKKELEIADIQNKIGGINNTKTALLTILERITTKQKLLLRRKK